MKDSILITKVQNIDEIEGGRNTAFEREHLRNGCSLSNTRVLKTIQ